MADTTYTAARDMEIQSVKIMKGQVVGTGDIPAGKFVAAKGLTNVIALGHAQARHMDGRFVEQQEAKAKPEAKPDPVTPPASESPTPETQPEPDTATVKKPAKGKASRSSR